jgi:hypothetical protein
MDCDILKVICSVNLAEFLVSVLVFTPPKHSAMAVWTSSLQHTGEVLAALLNKYKIGRFLKETVSQNGFCLCLICMAGMNLYGVFVLTDCSCNFEKQLHNRAPYNHRNSSNKVN